MLALKKQNGNNDRVVAIDFPVKGPSAAQNGPAYRDVQGCRRPWACTLRISGYISSERAKKLLDVLDGQQYQKNHRFC